MKGDDLVYDFTDDGIFDMLRIFVSPKISDILNENK
jgi:riboflavin biosynthesis pyrimidine reductase